MVNLEIARRRLHNQHITRREIETLQALVEWLGAVQAQDFAGARLWAFPPPEWGAAPKKMLDRTQNVHYNSHARST